MYLTSILPKWLPRLLDERKVPGLILPFDLSRQEVFRPHLVHTHRFRISLMLEYQLNKGIIQIGIVFWLRQPNE